MQVRRIAVTAMTLAALTAAPLLRADTGSISVAPAVVMLRGEAGQSTTRRITLTNGTSGAFAFEMKAQDAVVRAGKRLFVEAGAEPGSIAATAVFSRTHFTVPAGEAVDVDVTVTIPAKSAIRAVAILCQGSTRYGSGPLRMTPSVGTLLTFALTGDKIAAEASALNVDAPTATTNFHARQQISNSGSEPFVASGMLAILDSAGLLVGRQALVPWRLLPGEVADMKVEYGGDLPSGDYRAMITYDLTDKTLTSSADFKVR